MVADLHSALAWVVVFGNGLAGLWCLGAHWVERLRSPWEWRLVAAVQALLFVQVVLGVIRLDQLQGSAPQEHTLYGFLTLIAVAILYGYRSQLGHVRHLLYGGGSLFIMGLAIRAMVLDATPVL